MSTTYDNGLIPLKRHTIRQEDDVLYVTRKRSKSGVVFCLPLLGVGSVLFLFGSASVVGAIVGSSVAHLLSAAPIVVVGGLFGGLGAAAVFGHSGLTFDRRNQLVTQWIRVLMISRNQETPLAGFHQLLIDEHLWKGRPRYSLGLAGQFEMKVLVTCRKRDIHELAEWLSTWLKLPVHDRSARNEQSAA